MTAKELAELINGRMAGMELTVEEEREAKESGLVVLYVPSADKAVLRGAIMGCIINPAIYEHIYISFDGFLPAERCKQADNCPFFRFVIASAVEVNAEFNMFNQPYCKFTSKTYHETFRTYIDGGECYCVGLVFDLADIDRWGGGHD